MWKNTADILNIDHTFYDVCFPRFIKNVYRLCFIANIGRKLYPLFSYSPERIPSCININIWGRTKLFEMLIIVLCPSYYLKWQKCKLWQIWYPWYVIVELFDTGLQNAWKDFVLSEILKVHWCHAELISGNCSSSRRLQTTVGVFYSKLCLCIFESWWSATWCILWEANWEIPRFRSHQWECHRLLAMCCLYSYRWRIPVCPIWIWPSTYIQSFVIFFI